MKVHLMTCLNFENLFTRPTVIIFTDDLSNMFPMPEIQKPQNLSFQKITQKRIKSQNISAVKAKGGYKADFLLKLSYTYFPYHMIIYTKIFVQYSYLAL